MTRLLRSWPISLVWVLGAVSAGCGPEPVGVEACRKIESTRCEAAAACGLIEDVAACQRYFRDHCLHGVALEEEPGNVPVGRCVNALDLARECATKQGRDSAPTACQKEFFKDADAKNICEIVEEPQRASQCAFLIPDKTEKPTLDPKPSTTADDKNPSMADAGTE